MRKSLIFLAVLFLNLNIFAQDKKDVVGDSVSFGDNSIEWKVYETEAPVTSFAVVGNGIWYSTGAGVSFYDTKSTKKKPYPSLGKLSSAGIKTIRYSPKTGVWFAGAEGAVNLKGGKFKVFNSKNGLPSNNINKLAIKSSEVWFATDKGAAVYSGGNFKIFTTTEGLVNNVVNDIAFDDKGGVWLATNGGVSYLKSGAWKNYTVDDGLSFDEEKAITYDSRLGVVWLASGESDVCSFNGKEWSSYMEIKEGVATIMADTQSRIWFGSTYGIIEYNQDTWLTDPAKIGFPAAQVLDTYRDPKNGDLFFGMERGVLQMKNPYPY